MLTVTHRNTVTFSNVYGSTTSSSYSGNLTFPEASQTLTEIKVNRQTYSLPAGSTSLTIPLLLLASSNNTISIQSSLRPTTLFIAPPKPFFYPSTSFTPSGSAIITTCHPSLCVPVGSKIGYLSSTGSASLSITSPSNTTTGAKFTEVYFINNDIALATAWEYGTNTRNLTIGVNGVVTRIEVPLSGKSSELFSPGKGWEDTGVFGVLVGGWKEGENEVVVGNVGGDTGLVGWGADFVGLGVWW